MIFLINEFDKEEFDLVLKRDFVSIFRCILKILKLEIMTLCIQVT